MSQLLEHMEREFRIAGLLSGNDPLEEILVSSLRGLMKEFASQRHSGSTAHMVLSLFDRLVHTKPLTPLTGAPSEWVEIPADQQSGPTHQNIRCTTVFKYLAGDAIDVGMLPTYVTPDGQATTRSTDRPPYIKFPYIPGMPPVIAVDFDGNPI